MTRRLGARPWAIAMAGAVLAVPAGAQAQTPTPAPAAATMTVKAERLLGSGVAAAGQTWRVRGTLARSWPARP